MNILSIDLAVAKPTAYALFLDDKLSCFDKVPGITDIEDLVMMIVDLDLIVTEDMYLGMNVSVLKKLCYEVGKIIYVAESHQVKYRLIRPLDWKRHHGLLQKKPEYETLLQKQIIKNTTGQDIEDEDIRAAVLIGLCDIEERRFEK